MLKLWLLYGDRDGNLMGLGLMSGLKGLRSMLDCCCWGLVLSWWVIDWGWCWWVSWALAAALCYQLDWPFLQSRSCWRHIHSLNWRGHVDLQTPIKLCRLLYRYLPNPLLGPNNGRTLRFDSGRHIKKWRFLHFRDNP